MTPTSFLNENSNVQGNYYGRITFTAAAAQLTLTAANFDAGVGTDWSTHDFLYFAYASTRTTGTQFTGEYYIVNGASTLFFTAQGGDITRSAYTTASDWTPLILSINYARNLGFSPNNVASVSIRQKGSGPFPSAFGYDNLTLADGTDTPNDPVVPGNIAATPACSAYNVTITPNAVPGGTDPIFGYHVYRSTVAGGAGPYTSFKYISWSTGTVAFTEAGPFVNTTIYYKVLPYSVSTTAFLGGATGYFVLGGNSGMDPQNGGAKGGVHEALLSAATAAGPYDQTGACPTDTSTATPTQSPTPTQTPTQTRTSTATQTPTQTPTSTQTPTATPTGTPTGTPTQTPTSTQTPTATASGTPTASPTASPTETTTDTVTPLGPTGTFTETSTVSASYTESPSPTASPTATPTGTFTLVSTFTSTGTLSPTPTISLTFTETAVVTPTVVVTSSGTQLFPNPFHPDRGETFHLGNVAPGLRVNIYNIIGEFVIGFTTKGNPTEDRWDSLNANGVKVVTGIYFLEIDGKVYRVAVVRD